MGKTIVVLTRCEDYEPDRIRDALSKQLLLLGGLQKIVSRGEKVLLKPNFISPKSRRHAVQTDPEIIIQTAKLLRDFGAKPFLGDSPAWGNIFDCIRALHIEEPLRKLDVPVKQLDRPRWLKLGSNRLKVGISSVALEADKIINLPKFKSHQQLVATFAVKNMFGCVSGKQKAFWHFAMGNEEKLFCGFLIELYKMLKPAVTIIDGISVMDGQGPISGRARPLGVLIAGIEPISCEVVCGKIVGFEPDELPIVRAARGMGFGCAAMEEIEVVGENPDNCICNDFIRARPTPIRFSLPHVCKSICKQMLLLAKSALGIKGIQ